MRRSAEYGALRRVDNTEVHDNGEKQRVRAEAVAFLRENRHLKPLGLGPASTSKTGLDVPQDDVMATPPENHPGHS